MKTTIRSGAALLGGLLLAGPLWAAPVKHTLVFEFDQTEAQWVHEWEAEIKHRFNKQHRVARPKFQNPDTDTEGARAIRLEFALEADNNSDGSARLRARNEKGSSGWTEWLFFKHGKGDPMPKPSRPSIYGSPLVFDPGLMLPDGAEGAERMLTCTTYPTEAGGISNPTTVCHVWKTGEEPVADAFADPGAAELQDDVLDVLTIQGVEPEQPAAASD